MRRLFLALSVLLPLAACASTPAPPPEPIIVTKEVPVPVSVSCVPKSLGATPRYPDTDEALRKAGSAERRYQLLIAGRELRISRASETEPVIEVCRK